MAAQHTPGPWKWEPETKTIRSVPANYWIASMDSWDKAVNHEANAHLIEAAPDLLKALKEAVETLRDEGYTDADLAAMNAAITKAEGKPNL